MNRDVRGMFVRGLAAGRRQNSQARTPALHAADGSWSVSSSKRSWEIQKPNVGGQRPEVEIGQ